MAGRRSGGAVMLLGIYILLPLLFTSLYFIGNLYSFAALFELYNLSIITGALAYILFMAQFLLSARLRFIEKRFPQDKLLAFHGSMGMVIGGLVLSHFIIKYIEILRYAGPTLQSSLGIAALIIFALLTPAALLVLQGRGKYRSKSPPYARAKTRHNFFALAGGLAVAHVYLATSTWTLTLKLITLAWGIFCLAAYVWHKLIRPKQAISLELSGVEELAPEVTSYRFKTPAGEVPHRLSGQFGYFSFESDIPGKEEHPFTVASSGSDELEIIVKNSGDYTEAMPKAALNTKVAFDGPYGHFHPHRIPAGTPLYFIAGGIGITPFLSMIRDAELRRQYPMRLIWSVRNAEDVKAAQDALKLADKGEIELKLRYTRQGPDGSEQVLGRIDRGALAEFIPEAERKNASVFICGPQGFGKSIRTALKELKVSKAALHEEKFSW